MSEQQPSTPQPDVEGHAFKVRWEPAEVEGHAIRVKIAPVPGPEVESHGTGRTIDVARLTIEPVSGDPIVLEPLGADESGEPTYRVVSDEPDVEGHRKRWF